MSSLEKQDDATTTPSDNQTDHSDDRAAGPPHHGGSDIPDGGVGAWLTISGTWCVMFCTFGWINSIGIFQGYYQTTLLRTYSASTIAWIPSLQVFFLFFSSPTVGRLYDLYGPRYILAVGSFLHVFGLMMASISKEYYQVLLSQGVCSAIGLSALFSPAAATLTTWFHKKRGMAFGIASTGSSLGGVIYPIMVTRLISEVGYPWAMRICAFMILGLLCIAFVTIRTRIVPNPKSMTTSDLVAPFSDLPLMIIYVGFLFMTFGVFIPITYISISAVHEGMSFDLAQYLVSILNAASLFGRLMAGFLSDRAGTYNTFIVACLATGILILAMYIPASSNAAIIAFAALFGFTSGSYVSLSAPLVAKISPLPQIGYRTGLMLLISSVGGLTTNPIAGAIISDWNGSYTGMKIFSGVLMLAGTVLVVVSRLMSTNWKIKVVF